MTLLNILLFLGIFSCIPFFHCCILLVVFHSFTEYEIFFLRYADDTTLMAESEEELKRLLMKVKVESEKVGLK